MVMQRIFLAIVILLLAAIAGAFGYRVYLNREIREKERIAAETTPEPTPEATPEPTPEPTPTPTVDPEEDPRFYDPEGYLMIANKKHKLPDGYEPADLIELDVPLVHSYENQLREEPGKALMEMFDAAKEDGLRLILGSAYRSAEYQESLYNTYLGRNTKEYVDSVSSRPGYSDHQTGCAVDIGDSTLANYLQQSFENTAEGQWLFENAYKYGFILRYPKDKEDVTGYAYEPWHYRYVGKEYAKEIHEAGEGMTFEEFFGLKGGNYIEYE
jgi:LAS superfamily LD-carboxypeptidase LdcB